MCVTQVTVDAPSSASPVCHSVEMDVHIGHSDLSGSSILTLPDSSEPIRESHSSVSALHTCTHTKKSHLFMFPVISFSYWRVNYLTPAFLTFGLRPAWFPILTECVGRRPYARGRPMTASSIYQRAENSQRLL